jgi:cytochrome c
VIWRKVAAKADFTYSGALRSLGGAWSPRRLDDYLKDSQALAPGTSMSVVVEDETDRQAIITYLRTAQ